jgi:hypothetical protein
MSAVGGATETHLQLESVESWITVFDDARLRPKRRSKQMMAKVRAAPPNWVQRQMLWKGLRKKSFGRRLLGSESLLPRHMRAAFSPHVVAWQRVAIGATWRSGTCPSSLWLPSAARVALSLVLLLRAASGNIEIKTLGSEFKGAAAPMVMWILCFLAITLAIGNPGSQVLEVRHFRGIRSSHLPVPSVLTYRVSHLCC